MTRNAAPFTPMHRSPISPIPRASLGRRITAALALVLMIAAGCAGADEPTTAAVDTQAAGAATDQPAPAAPDTATPEAEEPTASTPTAPSEPEPSSQADQTDDGATSAPESSDTDTAAPDATESESPPAFVPPTGIEPARLVIDAIGVDATVIDLDLRGPEPEVPQDFAQVGWYTQTRLPGELGPAVLAGHIDSRTGPAVFALLDQLEPGDEITVTGDDGESRRFVVTGAGQYPKESLPDEVFGIRGDEADLRLITCGGTFDPSDGHYRDNYVVYASAA